MERDMMKVNEPHLVNWLITAVPVYGAPLWYDVLRSSDHLSSRLPNYSWPKAPSRIYGLGWSWIDKLDEIGYKRHLKHTASQAKSHHPDAFIRVRPDIINLHHKDASSQITEKWLKIRTTI